MNAEGQDVAPFAPPERPGRQSRLWRHITRLLFRYMANPALPPEVRRRRIDRLIGTVPLPRGTGVERVMAGGIPAEWILPPGVETEAVLLYLHGGGYAAGSFASYRLVAEKVAQAALVCISPWTDLAGTGESVRTKAGIDPCFTPEDLHMQAREYLGDHPMQPQASPLYADLRRLPPLLAQVGGDELLLDDARRLVERAQTAGVDATLEVWPGLWHIFATQGTFPESRQAMHRLGSFLGHRVASRVAAIPATQAGAEKTVTG